MTIQGDSKINMLKQQILPSGPIDENIAALFLSIDRRRYITKPYQDVAYADLNVPLRHGEEMLSPYLHAKMLQALQLQGHETVLELGTGNGFFTALLAALAHHVISIEFHKDLSQQAAANLLDQGIQNIDLQVGNAVNGWKLSAPVDVIVVTGGLHFLSEGLKNNLKPEGRILAFLNKGAFMELLLVKKTKQGSWHFTSILETRVPLLHRAGLPLPSFVF